MNKAKVQIKKEYGDYTQKKYLFWTDLEDLNAGDILTVHTQYGIQLAIFVEYTEEDFEPTKFILDRVSGIKVIERIKEQKDKLIKSKLDEVNEFIKKVYAL